MRIGHSCWRRALAAAVLGLSLLPAAVRAADGNGGDAGGADGTPVDWEEPPVFPEGFAALPNDPYVAVNRAAGEVMLAVALSDGMASEICLLEFLVLSGQENLDGYVLYDRGYEAVFTTRARPDPIFLACLLAGFSPGGPLLPIPEEGVMDNSGLVEGVEVDSPGRAGPAERVVMTMEWESDGVGKTARVEDFLNDRAFGTRLARTFWLFTGSYLVAHPTRGQTLAASMTQVLAATFYDRSALFNLPYFSANAYQEAEEGLVLDANTLPDDFRRRQTIVEGHDERTIWLPRRRRGFLHIRKATPGEAELPAEPTPGEEENRDSQ